jgi:replicative DNA helicase
MTDQDTTRSRTTNRPGDSDSFDRGNDRSRRDSTPLDLAPHSVEAEEAVLGAILMNPEAVIEVRAFLSPEDFFILRHGWIYEAILHIADEPENALDVRILAEQLRAQDRLDDIGGEAYLNYLQTSVPSALHAEVYAHLVERAAIRRRLLGAAGEIAQLAHNAERDINEVIDQSEATLFKVTEQRLRQELVPMQIAVSQYFDRIETLRGTEVDSLGVPTGFVDLDKMLGGLQKSDLLIFAGRPGMGKCVAAGTLVPTEQGLVPIEALKPVGVPGIQDDEGGIFYPLNITVQTPDGPRPTASFYDSGVKPTLRLTTRTGYSLTGTHVHPVMVLAADGEQVWTPLADLRVGDRIAVCQPELAAPVGGPARMLDGDAITHIEDAGMQHCYDLTVPDGHAFITNGIVSHNTSFLLTLALNAARAGKSRVAIFSMEMNNEQLVQRMISMETGISSQSLRLGQVTDAEWARFVQATGTMSDLKVFFDDSPALSAMQLRTKCRRLYREHGLDLIIVDYLQLMNAGTTISRDSNRVQEITYISRALKELARELNVPLLSAAQLSRAVEQRQDKRPQLSDLRESGCLTGDTPVVLADTGAIIPIRELVGQADFHIWALNESTMKLEKATVSRAFSTGHKPVYRLTTRLGRTIRATGNHKFRAFDGWQRLDALQVGQRIALPEVTEAAVCLAVGGYNPPLQTAFAGNHTGADHAGDHKGRLYDAAGAYHAGCGVIWDEIVAIEPDGVEEVFDLTVPGPHNFVAGDIIVHNSIEQDADIVMFLYRDEVYNEATEHPGEADVIVAKHRNGPTGTVTLLFRKELTKFVNLRKQRVNLNEL